VAGFLVTLERDIDEEHAETIVDALRLLRGVIAVKPVVGDISLDMAEDRARYELEARILKALREKT
jgi:hypothetical protein